MHTLRAVRLALPHTSRVARQCTKGKRAHTRANVVYHCGRCSEDRNVAILHLHTHARSPAFTTDQRHTNMQPSRVERSIDSIHIRTHGRQPVYTVCASLTCRCHPVLRQKRFLRTFEQNPTIATQPVNLSTSSRGVLCTCGYLYRELSPYWCLHSPSSRSVNGSRRTVRLHMEFFNSAGQ